jgi:hypothetical protein
MITEAFESSKQLAFLVLAEGNYFDCRVAEPTYQQGSNPTGPTVILVL